MKIIFSDVRNRVRPDLRLGLAALVIGLACLPAHAAVTIIGTQYRPDQLFPEFNCFWNASSYPTACADYVPGATVHVYLKNTGGAAVTIDDATLAGYSLKTIIKMSITGGINPDMQNSIYFYWDDPPADIMAAGEPVWWKADPPTIPPGGVAQAAVRLRSIPTTPTVSLGVVTSVGTVNTNIAVNGSAPRVASIGYSEDLKKIYIHWRRSGGAAPTSVWLNGTNVTALTTTVGDPSMNFAASVISLLNPLPFFSYHVYQGIYADGKTATASQRAWTNKFIYCTYSTFAGTADYTPANWIDEAADRGFNNVQFNLGLVASYLGTSGGRAHMAARGYGYTPPDTGKLNIPDPDMWFLNDEPDTEEQNQSRAHCGTGLRIPCDSSKYSGTLVIKEAVGHAAELRALRPNVPMVVNLDGGLQPQSWYTWGPALDILQSNNYYDVRLRDSNWFLPERIPLYRQAKLSYAVARTGTAGAEPNPFNHLLYSCKWRCDNADNCGTHTGDVWPFPTPESKRFEIYYSLAGGSKGMGYWWIDGGWPSYGLKRDGESAPLWKEMGLCGNEIKTARNLIVKSTPVDLPLTPSTNVWVRAAASGIDAFILYVVNDNYYSDPAGCHYTLVSNATVTVTLPVWMQNSPGAFEITAGGLRDVSTQLNGNQLQVNLGTLKLTRMIVLTTDPTLRTVIQQRYDTAVRPYVCNFAPELCVNNPPSISQQPANRTVPPGGTTNLTVVASGTGTLGYRWQKNSANLNNGGHYAGVTTGTLTISTADANDTANYRCVVTNAYGSVMSSVVTLTVTNVPNMPPVIMQPPSNQGVDAGGTVNFTVSAIGTEPLNYQWQKNNSNLSNGGHYSGCATPTLTITGADNNDVASYRCSVTNAYGSTNSASASLNLNLNLCSPGVLLGHGDMEDGSGYSVCPDWQSYSAGAGVPTWAKEAVIIHGGAAAQKARNINGGTGSILGVRQTFDANVGDAFTFEGWVNPASQPAYQQVAMVAMWNGATGNPVAGSGTWNISTGARLVWTQLQNLSGNATSNRVTLFLDSRQITGSIEITAYWDDVVSYRAYVPPAPMLSAASSTTLNVDPLPGCNTNGTAQFAISIGGGAYTLGTHWVQANGTVSTTPVWQSDAAWALKTVTGLVAGTSYTFKVQARYSGALPQPTALGGGAAMTPTATQPPQITQQPSPQNVCPGANAMFSVTATGTSLTYQWQTNGANLSDGAHYSGATSPTLTVINAGSADAANYRCVVTGAGSTNSAPAALTLKAATLITTDPDDQVVAAGENATLSVTATGEGALTYQWLTNGVNLSNNSHYIGATSATLIVSNATSADSADYRCVVTGGCGGAESGVAAVTVVTPGLCLGTLNADFEGGFSLAGGGYIANHWIEWEADPGVIIGYEEPTIIHGGGRGQRIRVWGGPSGSSGGVYQQVPVTVGQAYSVGVWTYSADNLTTCSLGVDPTGGTDATGVTWSAGSTNTAWVQQTIAGAAMASYITIYLKVATTDDTKRNGYFDDGTTGSSNDSIQLSAQRNGDDLVLTWPECPNAHLERTASLTPPVSWATATNQPTVIGGQKSVTITPIGSAGYYRLLLD